MARLEQPESQWKSKGTTSAASEKMLRDGDRIYQEYFQPEQSENRLQDALNAYACALEQNPDRVEPLCGLAKTLLLLGHYDKAERTVRKAMTRVAQADSGYHPPQRRRILYEAQCILGTLHFRRGELDEAIQSFCQAIGQRPWQSSLARYGLFESLRDQAWHRAFDLKAFTLTLHAIYALVSGILLIPFDRTELASLARWLVLVPQCAWAWILEECGKQESLLNFYLDLQAKYPGLVGLGTLIGEICMNKGETELARYWLEKTIARHPGDLDAQFHLARLMEREEDYIAMANLYKGMVMLRPADPHLWCNLANACYYSQNYKEALGYYETAFHLGRDPRWKAMVAQSMGNIQTDYLQNSAAAIAYYETAKTLDPKDVENYMQLGMLYYQREDYINAELIYRQALTVAPANARLASNLGYLRWMAGDMDRAIAYYQQAIALESDYEIPLNNLGVIHLDMLGQVYRAIELFEEAISLAPEYALAYYNLGRAYSFTGSRTEAANCFRKAQELNHDSRDLDNDDLTARINNLFDTCEIERRD